MASLSLGLLWFLVLILYSLMVIGGTGTFDGIRKWHEISRVINYGPLRLRRHLRVFWVWKPRRRRQPFCSCRWRQLLTTTGIRNSLVSFLCSGRTTGLLLKQILEIGVDWFSIQKAPKRLLYCLLWRETKYLKLAYGGGLINLWPLLQGNCLSF